MQLIKTARGGITTRHGEDAGRSRPHVGIDIGHGNSTAEDLRMVAPAAGKVTAAGWSGTYGLRVIIAHPDGSESLIAHMDRLAVGVGYEVAQGDDIGVMGRTGGPWGSIAGWFVHGHQEYHVGGIAVDPLLYMAGGPMAGQPAPTPYQEDSMANIVHTYPADRTDSRVFGLDLDDPARPMWPVNGGEFAAGNKRGVPVVEMSPSDFQEAMRKRGIFKFDGAQRIAPYSAAAVAALSPVERQYSVNYAGFLAVRAAG